MIQYIFALTYLLVDLLYVATSKKAYEDVVKKIQGKGFPGAKPSRIIAACIAYGSMVLVWLGLVVPMVHMLIENKKRTPLVAGIWAGSLYGLLAYGVFNGTLHVMFENWDIAIMIRDMVWGVGWATTLTVFYALYISKSL